MAAPISSTPINIADVCFDQAKRGVLKAAKSKSTYYILSTIHIGGLGVLGAGAMTGNKQLRYIGGGAAGGTGLILVIAFAFLLIVLGRSMCHPNQNATQAQLSQITQVQTLNATNV